jgi:hypothetical protein
MNKTFPGINFNMVASVRKDLIEGDLQIGVGGYPHGGGSYETFQNRPAIQAPPRFGDAYIVLLEDCRLVVTDACDLDVT